ncbi:hypothetical protein HDU76_011266, partial [Blyttiomyces sp. JEL0837]
MPKVVTLVAAAAGWHQASRSNVGTTDENAESGDHIITEFIPNTTASACQEEEEQQRLDPTGLM